MRGDLSRRIAAAGPGALTQSVEQAAHPSPLSGYDFPPDQLSSCSMPPLV